MGGIPDVACWGKATLKKTNGLTLLYFERRISGHPLVR